MKTKDLPLDRECFHNGNIDFKTIPVFFVLIVSVIERAFLQ